MNKFFIAVLSCLSFCGFTGHLQGTSPQSDSERSTKLLPGLTSPLAVKFAIPDDYVVGAHPGGYESTPNMMDGVLWAPEKTLELIKSQFAKGGIKDLPTSYLEVYLSTDIIQTGANELSVGPDEEIRDQLQQVGAKNITIKRLSWGQFPVVAITFFLENDTMKGLAWVGLSNGRGVICFSYRPASQKGPHDADLALWNTFIEKTQPLEPNKE